MVSQTGLEPATLCTPCIDSTFEILAVNWAPEGARTLDAESLLQFGEFVLDEGRGPLGLDEAISTLVGFGLHSVESGTEFVDSLEVSTAVGLGCSDGEHADGFRLVGLDLASTLDALDVLDLVVHVVVCGWESNAPEGAGTYQSRPMVTQRAMRMATSMTMATTQRVPILYLFMWLVVGCAREGGDWLLVFGIRTVG